MGAASWSGGGTLRSMFVTARSPIGTELAEALTAAGLEVGRDHDRLSVDGRAIELPVVVRSHPHPGEVRELVAHEDGPALLVADRISDAGREALRAAGWSWLDRRGHVRLWIPGLRVDAAVDVGGDDGRGTSSSPWTTVGLEVALHALCHPEDEVRARAVAADIGRSAGGTQEIIGRFTEHGLIGRTSRLPLLPDLFWETSSRWPDDDWVALPVELPVLSAELGKDTPVRVDERAATLGGARIAAAADLPARCYVTSRSALRRARALAEPGSPARTFVRTSPVAWLPELEGFAPDDRHPWRGGPPVVSALPLAKDASRGGEIVEDWGIAGGGPA